MSGDTTLKKVSSATSPRGAMGQIYLTSGKRVAMRLWRDEPPGADKPSVRRDYETVGYVIAGRAELTVEGQTLRLEPGDAWLVPAGACLPHPRAVHRCRGDRPASPSSRAG
jgi:mannose-6-phosphate isomerase-like protein (cupin superfamily)